MWPGPTARHWAPRAPAGRCFAWDTGMEAAPEPSSGQGPVGETTGVPGGFGCRQHLGLLSLNREVKQGSGELELVRELLQLLERHRAGRGWADPQPHTACVWHSLRGKKGYSWLAWVVLLPACRGRGGGLPAPSSSPQHSSSLSLRALLLSLHVLQVPAVPHPLLGAL